MEVVLRVQNILSKMAWFVKNNNENIAAAQAPAPTA